MNLEEYLISKKIDSVAFRQHEPELWKVWQHEFESMHPNSFTAQKLYLINPIRRKYPFKSLAIQAEKAVVPETFVESPVRNDESVSLPTETIVPKPILNKPTVPKPVFKPKPKIS